MRMELTCIQGEWLATGTESGTKFTGIDLTEGEWFDYGTAPPLPLFPDHSKS